MASTSSSVAEAPHPLLTKLQQRPPGASSELPDAAKPALLAEAQKCIGLMMGRRDVDGEVLRSSRAPGGVTGNL